MNPTRVFIVAASAVVRAGLRSMLTDVATTIPGRSVEVVGDGPPDESGVGAALSGAEVVLVSGESLLEESLLEGTDFAAPDTQGAPDESAPGLVLLSDDEGEISRLAALGSGAWGAVSPEATPEELAAAVVAVANGFVVVPAPRSQGVFVGLGSFGNFSGVGGFEGPPDNGGYSEESPEPLTAREKEVLESLSRGLANKSIARELSISEHTVKFHVSSVYAKLGVQSRAEAVSRGARLGLLKL